jgi:predicted nucleic acid-binding protein
LSVFVDTSVLYAAVDHDDIGHARAAAVVDGEEPLVCTDHVLVETMLLVSRRAGWRTAERFWRGLRSGIARIEITTQADLEVASSIGERFPDQQFSLVDRTSFAVMHRLGITRVASFDKDFAVYRFGPDRRMAFVVV